MSGEVAGSYTARLLRVDLTRGNISEEVLDGAFCRQYIGGAGFVIYHLWKELPPGVDPLGPQNKLVFAAGPVTGVSLPGSGRHCVGAKSPLTGGIAKSEAGEFWGSELRRAGYDVVIIEGKAERPVYLWINDGVATLRDARHLWGKTTKETQLSIRQELGDDKVRVAMIGPAGEKLVRYACIMHGLFDAAGRGGLGAVMGSKNLKAVAVRGHQVPSVADPESLNIHRKWLLDNMDLVRAFKDFGTGVAMVSGEAAGNLPVRNWRDGLFPGVTAISSQTIRDTFRIGMEGCFACPVRCKKVVKVEGPNAVDPDYGGPEYEGQAVFGSNCGIDSLKAVLKANELCNAFGLDVLSTGGTIAFAMECFERKLITEEDTGGLALKFGDYDAMLRAVELIARREGFGDLLAEGTARVAKKIGKGASDFAMHVKGLEPGMHDPRRQAGFGVGYMVNPHGADHCCNLPDHSYSSAIPFHELRPLGLLEPLPALDTSPRKVLLLKTLQGKNIIRDCLSICMFIPYDLHQMAAITAAVTGWDTAAAEQLRVAERILTVARLFNVREGFTDTDDELPLRYYQPKTDGVLSKTGLDRSNQENAKRYYYNLMGWDRNTGVPSPEKVLELGIN
ncbi:MAG: aldehyde ferredoxin oxidoreductase family protein [Dehalococcoidia bacterium]|nr:aldehyde ferredoxin oxidoreductase family protein [Dehalococcoidia bacterium]